MHFHVSLINSQRNTTRLRKDYALSSKVGLSPLYLAIGWTDGRPDTPFSSRPNLPRLFQDM